MGTARVVFDRWDGRYAAAMAGVRSSAVRDLFAAASRPDVISLSGGMPDVRRVPHDAVEKAVRDALRHDGASALQYGSSDGRFALRTIIVGLMGETGVRLSEDDLIVTAGAQQGLDLLAKVFLDPGDVVICEGPTYVGALQAFSVYRPATSSASRWTSTGCAWTCWRRRCGASGRAARSSSTRSRTSRTRRA